MDPEATLRRALELIDRMGISGDERAELAEALRNLANWIERDGFLPSLDASLPERR